MAADLARDFAINLARWKPSERASLTNFVSFAARDLQLGQPFRWIDRAQQHDVGIVALPRFAGVDQLQRARRLGATAPHMGKDRLALFARVPPDMPAGGDQILFDEGAAADEGLAVAELSNID